MHKTRILNNVQNMDTLCLGLYTLAIVLGALKEDLGDFLNQGSFKDGLTYVLLECFYNFLFDPYCIDIAVCDG